ncbi:MAG TPA: hypothetical protein PLU37_02145, partial [Chitinophagaceae bacterium]|nr:hypothetical protein [Chitinophagaceae bacterium]
EMTYFCSVKQTGHTLFRKLVALFLLGQFCFIYAEKVLHTHEIRSSSFSLHHDGPVIKKSACIICDFQLNKEFITPILSIPDPLLVSFKDENVELSLFTYPETFFHITSRGPPASLFHLS